MSQKFAVVTGANKGIGFEIVRQLASEGITVVLTARDEKRGLEALHKLKNQTDISDKLVFHQLDVADSSSVASLAYFVKTQFGKLDILVNNAGVNGGVLYSNSGEQKLTLESMVQTYEAAEECLLINYYGAKATSKSLIPFLRLSDSPRIVNVSSILGRLQDIGSDWAKKVLNDVENLSEERIDEVVREFLKDFKEGSLESKGWPAYLAAYRVSKAAMSAYTRVLAKNQPEILVNCVCPGPVNTDMTFNTGALSAEEGAASPVRLALLPNDGPSGLFFFRSEVSQF